MADRKVGEITVPTEPVSRATKITGFTFKSYDKNAGVLQFNIENQDGSPTDLIDATVRLFMYIYQGEEKKEFPIFDNQIITESYMQGIVKYRIPDMLLSYEGKVDANVYIDFPDGSHTDNLAFTFTIEKSIIDDNVQLNGEYYFKDFQQLLDGVKQEATDAVNAALTNIDTVSQNVTSAQNNLKAVEDKMNQTNQQIGDLGKLKKMYSNSIDFGDYDYSGNPNLMRKLSFEDWDLMGEGITKADANGEYVSFDFSGEVTDMNMYAGFSHKLPLLKANQKYTLTAEVSTDVSWEGRIRMSYRINKPDGSPAPSAVGTLIGDVNNPQAGVWYELTTMENNHTIPDLVNNYKSVWLQINLSNRSFKGKLNVRYNIKIEEGETSTPYQPNLLDAPYYLSKKTLGKNLLDPTGITSSSYLLLTKTPSEKLLKDQTYTITLKGTKPATQTFRCFVQYETDGSTVNLLDMKPVEGLVDEWQLTFKATRSASDITGRLYVYQVPNTSLGQCKVEWIKLEKGDTRTPNISQFKYFGEGLKDSNNPNDYSWDITPEYAEKGLNDTVSLTEPQSVEGLKNFEDGLQVRGKEVATVAESTGWLALTLVDGFEVA
ncbi:BppU family phage baseplate upper protein, partial [Enterococcus faecium]|uniref:BppU family phage baseplate upper protein n=1 Tax=Enterococcus faecium TaxID=1352 RepID=UPI003BA0A2A4